MKKMRRIPFENAHNIRDLGGYATSSTGVSAWHRLYRSDHLCALKPQEWRQLQMMNIKLILDLRSASERKTAPYDALGITTMHIPFMKEEQQVAMDLSKGALDKFLSSMKLDYVEMAHRVPENISKAIHEIALCLEAGGAVLFHCTAGKDRTGILACLLLMLCGVQDEDILADYQVSATYNQLGVNQMLPPEYRNNPAIQELFESRVDMLQPLLDDIHALGIEQWLMDVGCDKKDFQRIQTIMCK